MRLLTLCAVLCVVLTVSLASPVQVHDVSESYSSSEEKEDIKVPNIVTDNSNVEDNSASSSEEQQPQKGFVVKDEAKDENSSEEDKEKPKEHNIIVVIDDDEILDIKTAAASRAKRSFDIDNTLNSQNQLKVKDEGTIKYDKYLKLKRLRRDLQNDESGLRFTRSTDTSEENSSEEQKKGNKQEQEHNHEAGQEHSSAKPADAHEAAPAENLDIAPAAEVQVAVKAEEEEEEHAKTDSVRRRRNLEDEDLFSDNNLSEQVDDVNEVFTFSNENQQASAENFKDDQLKSNEYVVLNVNDLKKHEVSLEKKTSEEDYAQGCGGSNGNQNEDSKENSNEDNETTYNTL